MPSDSGRKEQFNVRLSAQARKKLQDLAALLSLSQADILELLLKPDIATLREELAKRVRGY